MEYIYAAMLLHSAGKKITEAEMKKVLEAAGVKADATRIKATVVALEGVNIEEAIKKASVAPAPAAAQTVAKEEKKEKKEEETEEKKEEEAAEGLAALFG